MDYKGKSNETMSVVNKDYADGHMFGKAKGFTNPTDGSTLVWDASSGTWITQAMPSATVGASKLTELSDVTIDTPTDGQNLVYDSSTGKFKNRTITGYDSVNKNLVFSNSGYLDTTNVKAADSYYVHSDYIPLNMLKGVTVSVYATQNVQYFAIFSSNKRRLQYFAGENTTHVVSLDDYMDVEGAYYVRFSGRKSDAKVTNLAPASTFGVADIYSKLVGNPFVVSPRFINTSGKFVTSGATGYKTTKLIRAESLVNAQYSAYVASSSALSLAFYDKDGTFISGVRRTDASIYTITAADIPDGAVYAAFCGMTSYSPYVVFTQAAIATIGDSVEGGSGVSSSGVPTLYRFSNGKGCNDEGTDRITQLTSAGAEATTYGEAGNVTKFSIGNVKYADKLYIRFRFKVNQDVNVASDEFLKLFTMVGGATHSIGIQPNAFIQNTQASLDYADLLGQAKIRNTFGSNVNTLYTLDGWVNKRMTGRRAFGMRYTGSASSVTVSNDGVTLSTSAGDAWTLASYATMYDLYAAIEANGNYDVRPFEITTRTPAELAKFSDIELVNVRGGESNSDWFYIPLAINEEWHTFEFMADTAQYASLPIISIDGKGYTLTAASNATMFTTNGKDITIYVGGDASGSNMDVTYKDIEIRKYDTGDAELLINATSGYTILSDWSPRILVYTMHDMIDAPFETIHGNSQYKYCTATDRLNWFLNLAKSKGYQPVTAHQVVDHVLNGLPVPRKSILLINDDLRMYVYLDRRLRSAFTASGWPITLALQHNYTEFTFDGKTYDVKDIVEMLRGSGGNAHSHYDGESVPSTVSGWESWKENFYLCERLLIDTTIQIYVNGYTNPMVENEMQSEGVKGAFTTTKGIVSRLSNPMRIPRLYIDDVDSEGLIKNYVI